MMVTKTKGPFSVTALADQSTGQLSRMEITIAPSARKASDEPLRLNLSSEAYRMLKQCLLEAEEEAVAENDDTIHDIKVVTGIDKALYLVFPTNADSAIFLESLGLQYPLPLQSCGNFENAVMIKGPPRPFTHNTRQ